MYYSRRLSTSLQDFNLGSIFIAAAAWISFRLTRNMRNIYMTRTHSHIIEDQSGGCAMCTYEHSEHPKRPATEHRKGHNNLRQQFQVFDPGLCLQE
jgi:hypothetical protein